MNMLRIDLDRLTNEVSHLKNELYQKSDNHEISQIISRLVSLECSCWQLRSEVDGILSRLQALEESR